MKIIARDVHARRESFVFVGHRYLRVNSNGGQNCCRQAIRIRKSNENSLDHLVAVLGSFCWTILAKVGATGVDSNLATAVRTSVILLLTWAVVLFDGKSVRLWDTSAHTCLFLVLSGVGTAPSWLCYFHALQIGPASRVAPVDKLSVAFVIVFAAVFLGEHISITKIVGGVLIVAGAIVLALE